MNPKKSCWLLSRVEIKIKLRNISLLIINSVGQCLKKGFWSNIVVIPAEGRPPIAFDWYRSFIQTLLDAEAYTYFAPMVAYGELLVGIALILGFFTGIAAFFGAFMNWNFMMAGPASTIPMLFIVALGLILAWKIPGYIGLDYFLLRWIGTPWKSEVGSELQPEGQ